MGYRGDFSKEVVKRKGKNTNSNDESNFNGVLHQQGRVLTDADSNAQTIITNDWQDTAGRDIISGKKVAAIPADNPDGFKVKSALVSGDKIKIVVAPGMAWVDGMPVYLESEADVSRIAYYLGQPIQDSPTEVESIGEGVRDVAILECWRDEVHAFQMPDLLIEPALGGPDTTERIDTAIAFRLLRLTAGEDCANIADKLKDDLSKKGRLTASLEPPRDVTSDCNCPVTLEGGYTGFEHALFRFEVARQNSGIPAMFKWSQFNGGLVGRGTFDAATNKVAITANLQAIQTSGLGSFYLEVIEYDEGRGHRNVTFGARATLTAEGDLQISGLPLFGNIPTTTSPAKSVFFRLWNDIRPITDFVGDRPAILKDGIHLKFDPPNGDNSNYAPEDHWTCSVRAGGISNHEVLIDNEPPQGFQYHRVPLGILNWNGATDINGGQIEDCREIFKPFIDTKAFYYVSGDGQEAPPGSQLPFPIIAGVANANNSSPARNVLVRFTVASGGGTLGTDVQSTITVPTGPDGLAVCTWILGDKADQQVKAEMLEESGGEPIHLPLFFNAKTESSQGNCTIVVHPEDDIAAVIEKLPAAGGKICFTSGIFNLKKTIQIDSRSNILIEGTGNASQIIITGAESTFLFNSCKRIHLNQLYLESRSPSAAKINKPKIKGVIMFSDCKEIKATNLALVCNQRFIHTQSCLTFNNKDSSAGSEIEISSCTFHVSSMQIGILLVNTNNVIIKDNFIDAAPGARSKILFGKSSVLKNNLPYRNLIFALDRIGKPLASAQKALNASTTVNKLLEQGLLLQKAGKSAEAMAILKRGLDLHKRSGVLLDQALSRRNPEEKRSRFQGAVSVHKSITISLTQAISSADGTPNVKLIKQAQSVIQNTLASSLEQEIASIGDAEKSSVHKELSLNRSIVYSAILGRTDAPQISPGISKMVAAVTRDLAIGYQGIVISGVDCENVQIFNNTILGMAQGIHAGVSISDPKKLATKYIKKISICGNKIGLRIPDWYSDQKHGIFVANADISYVKDNTISVERINNIGLKSHSALSPTVGIQIFGFHGKMVLVLGNVASNPDIGIRFCTVGFLPQHGPKNTLRTIMHNVVYGSNTNYDLSGSVDVGSIKFVDNIP